MVALQEYPASSALSMNVKSSTVNVVSAEVVPVLELMTTLF